MNDTAEMLTADRRRLLKEHLMNEVAREERAPQSRRKLVWLVASPLAVGAVAAVALVGPGRHAGRPVPAASASTTSAVPTTSAPATPSPEPTDPAGLLSRAAKAIASRPDPGATAGQFTYQREVQDGGGRAKHERKMWFAVDGKSDGLIVDPTMSGGPTSSGGNVWPAPLATTMGDPTKARQVLPSEASFTTPTYQFLASLPTDPHKLYQQLLAVDRSMEVAPPSSMTQQQRYQLAFADIQRVFMNVTAPPAVAGSLMEAAAEIPGTSVVADEVDAAGRHGVAVVGLNGTMRVSLIFDSKTGAYLGVREVLLRYLQPVGPDGTPPAGNPSPDAVKSDPWAVFATAALQEGITDHAGDEPKG